MSSPQSFFPPNPQDARAVHFQQLDCGAPLGCLANKNNALPRKVRFPDVPSRIVEGNVLAGEEIKRRPPAFLSKRTINTGQREILSNGLPAIEFGDDVINVEGSFLRCLGQATVFAPLVCARDDQPAKMGGNASHQAPLRRARSARRRNNDKNSETSTSPSASRRSLEESLPSRDFLSRRSWSLLLRPAGSRNPLRSPGISNSIRTLRPIFALRKMHRNHRIIAL